MLDRNAVIVLCVAVLTVLIGGAVVWLFISLKRLRGELSERSSGGLAALRKDNDRTRELTLKLGASLTEIREGLSDTAARLAEAEKDLQDIADRLNEVESQDPDAKMYSRAVTMSARSRRPRRSSSTRCTPRRAGSNALPPPCRAPRPESEESLLPDK